LKKKRFQNVGHVFLYQEKITKYLSPFLHNLFPSSLFETKHAFAFNAVLGTYCDWNRKPQLRHASYDKNASLGHCQTYIRLAIVQSLSHMHGLLVFNTSQRTQA